MPEGQAIRVSCEDDVSSSNQVQGSQNSSESKNISSNPSVDVSPGLDNKRVNRRNGLMNPMEARRLSCFSAARAKSPLNAPNLQKEMSYFGKRNK